MKQKAFWGTLLLLTAISLVLYGIGLGPSMLGMPIYKLILSIVLFALIFAKVAFSSELRQRFKVFTLLSFLFMVLESEIARWANLPDANIINNWLLLLAAIIADIAMGIIIPKKDRKKHSHRFHVNIGDGGGKGFEKNIFGEKTIYIDANATQHSSVDNCFGEMRIYYQNTDIVNLNSPLTLEINNKFGELRVHVPEDWTIVNEMKFYFGELYVRENSVTDGIKLIITGSNTFGETKII